MKQRAFTLAEVLITLSIIGVVAALTIPSLIAKNQEKQTITQLKKAYNTLSNAYALAVLDYGNPNDWGWTYRRVDGEYDLSYSQNSSYSAILMLSQYLNITKICGNPNIKECYTSLTHLNGHQTAPLGAGAILNDGMNLMLTSWSNGGCFQHWGTTEALKGGCAEIDIDINGFTPPNIFGKDTFGFYITKGGIIPIGSPQETNNTITRACGTTTPESQGCTAWVLLKENQDYLKRTIFWD